MREQSVLRFLRIDVDPTADDHERLSISEIQIALFVYPAHITQRGPSMRVGTACRFFGVVVIRELMATFKKNVTGLTNRQFNTVCVNNMNNAEF